MKKIFVAIAMSIGLIAVPTAVYATGPDNSTTNKVLVCKYVGTPGDGERFSHTIEPNKNALDDGFDGTFPWTFSDAQGRSIAIGWADGSLDASDCPAADEGENETPAPDVEEWHSWKVPAGVVPVENRVGEDGFPQPYVGPGKLTPTECGVYYQVDRYKTSRENIDAVLADGFLLYGEDWDIIEEWYFTYGGDCVEVVVPEKPKPITVTTEWVAGEFVCGDEVVTETRTVTNVGHILIDNVWVANPLPSDRSKTETRERPLTEGEIASLDCPIDVPGEPEEEDPIEELPEETPKEVEKVTNALPTTGSEFWELGLYGLVVLLLGGGLFAAAKLYERS